MFCRKVITLLLGLALFGFILGKIFGPHYPKLSSNFKSSESAGHTAIEALEAYSGVATTTAVSTTSAESNNESERRLNCTKEVNRCYTVVTDEIYKTMKRKPLCSSNQPKESTPSSDCERCEPKKRKVKCEIDTKVVTHPGLVCPNKQYEFTVDEYDYATQLDCLVALARQVGEKSKTRVPRIGHTVYYHGESSYLSFEIYVSMLSLIEELQAYVYFFWNEGLPHGRWMSELLLRLESSNASALLNLDRHLDGRERTRDDLPRFISVHRQRPGEIYGRRLAGVSHSSDVTRIQALALFGGVYLDCDSYAVNRLDAMLNVPFASGYEMAGRLASSAVIGSYNSSFAFLWHCEYTDYNAGAHLLHALERPHFVAERCPHLIQRENTSLAQPSGYPEYGGMRLMYGENVYFNLSNNYAVHGFLNTYDATLRGRPRSWIFTSNTTMGRLWRSKYFNIPLEHDYFKPFSP